LDAAVAAVIAGPAVGAVAILASVWQGRDQRTHDRALVRSEREFAVKKEVYVEMLRYARWAIVVVNRTEPRMGPASDPPTAPTDEEWIAMEARVAVFASPEVEAAFSELGDKVTGFHIAVFEYRHARAQPSGEWIEERNTMYGVRDDVRGLFRELTRIAREELAAA
jgi:hypothetical protein